MDITDVVKNIQHQRAITSSHLINDQVMIWMVREHVIRDEVASHSFAVVGPEELGGCVPQLACFIG